MTLALGHPTLGYYQDDVRLGADGDFVTSPELSQIFGELIGLGLAAAWQAADGPLAHLVELGPGNGTLMADLWRATARVPGWHDALDVHLVETSASAAPPAAGSLGRDRARAVARGPRHPARRPAACWSSPTSSSMRCRYVS